MEAFKKGKIDFDRTIEFLGRSWLNEPLTRVYSGKPIEIRPIDILVPPIKLLFHELNGWLNEDNFEMNVVVLNDSFILKIEAILRYFCERIGIATFKPRDKGIVMEKNIDDLLADLKSPAESTTLLDENDRLFIKYFLSEKIGFNLRNKIAHGLMDIYDYNLDGVILAFTIILRLTRYQFVENKI